MHKRFLFSWISILMVTSAWAQDSIGWWRWLNPRPQGNPLYAVQFRDERAGIAIGRDGIILRTNNGGTEWENVRSPIRTPLYGLAFMGQKNGLIRGVGTSGAWVAVGARGTTSDRGKYDIGHDSRAVW